MLKNKKFLLISTVISGIFLISFFVYRNMNPRYDSWLATFIFVNKGCSTVELKFPKHSFDFKEKDSYVSSKSLNSSRVLRSSLKDVLSNYEKISCNSNVYYYDALNDFTIIDYGINNHFPFSTLYYEYSFGDYCKESPYEDYIDRIDYMTTYTYILEEDNKLYEVIFETGANNNLNSAKIKIQMSDIDTKEIVIIEESKGFFELIEPDILRFERISTSSASADIMMPKISEFLVENKSRLILKGNYFSNYVNKEIVMTSSFNN